MSVDLTGELPGLIYEKRDHIAYITINRPDRANTLHSSMVEPIKAIWAEVRDDPWIRCSVVTATGDQKRIMTPARAIEAGANYLVVGRPVLEAREPKAAADAIVAEIEQAAKS